MSLSTGQVGNFLLTEDTKANYLNLGCAIAEPGFCKFVFSGGSTIDATKIYIEANSNGVISSHDTSLISSQYIHIADCSEATFVHSLPLLFCSNVQHLFSVKLAPLRLLGVGSIVN